MSVEFDLYRWPSVLPLPLLKGQQVKHNSGVVREKAVSGRTRNIPRFKRPPAQMPITMQFSKSDFLTFLGWHDTVLNNGARPFTMPVQIGNVTQDHTVQFVSELASTQNSGLVRVTATIEVTSLYRPDANQTLSAMFNVDSFAADLEAGLSMIVNDYLTPDA